MNLSFTLKFYFLYEHDPSILLSISDFYNIEEDAIQRQYQIRVRHYARIESLRSEKKQKENRAKNKHITTSANIINTITEVNKTTKRKLKYTNRKSKLVIILNRKESVRLRIREAIKIEVSNKVRCRMLAPYEILKEEYKNTHAL